VVKKSLTAYCQPSIKITAQGERRYYEGQKSNGGRKELITRGYCGKRKNNDKGEKACKKALKNWVAKDRIRDRKEGRNATEQVL